MVKRKDDVTLQEEALASQIPEFTETPQEEVHVPEKISSRILNRNQVDEEEKTKQGKQNIQVRTLLKLT